MMSESSYNALLEKAKELYVSHPYEKSALKSGTVFFHGAFWMAGLMADLRSDPVEFPSSRPYGWYGIFKYALAVFFTLLFLLIAFYFKTYYLFPISILIFYLAEAQFIFLFPILIDNSSSPLVDSLRMTHRAGGTLSVLRILLSIALYMVSGGLTKNNFMKNWIIGCIMMVVWYEKVRKSNGGKFFTPPPATKNKT
jgi:hypothetical protein